MIKITVIALGKLKEKYFLQAAEEYKKRLSRYCDLKITELNPVKLSDNPSSAECEAALEREADMILKSIPNGSTVIALCVEGKELSSEALAETVSRAKALGKPLTYIIGSSYGLAKKIKQKSDMRLSLSQMTFPHKLFRIMLLEQLYRAFKINEGSAYHK